MRWGIDWQGLFAIALVVPRYLTATYLRRGHRPNGETA